MSSVIEKIVIDVQYASRLHNLPRPADFRLWAKCALRQSANITLRIVNAAEGRNLNSAFRGKDHATNVLAFIYHDPGAKRLQGDVVLCAPVVAHEARLQGKSLHDHYAHLTVHGLLHLAGEDHETARGAARMEKHEIAILAALGVANPYL